MAKTATATSDEAKKKSAAATAAPTAKKAKNAAKTGKSAKAGKVGKTAKAGKAAKAGKGGKASKKNDGFDGLAKLVDHPLVADLLAAGAIAAVTAIAQHQMGKGASSSKMVKSVGKAAATAMGLRLMGDLTAVGGAAADAAKKA